MRRRIAFAALAAAVAAAAPSEARMSRTAVFGSDFALPDLSGAFGARAMQPGGDPSGALFGRMLREFSEAPERLPRRKPRNDIEATLDAMESARVGFGEADSRKRRRANRATPKS